MRKQIDKSLNIISVIFFVIVFLMPSGNAYGKSGNTSSSPEIPEDAILIFDIHLIKIRK